MTGRTIFVLAIGLVLSAIGSVASAQGKVAVGSFEGPGASMVKKAVLELLDEHSVEVVPSRKALATARRTGAELDTESGRVRVARKLKLTGFVEGQTERDKRTIKVHIVVYGPRDGMPAGELNLSAPRNVAMRELRATFWGQLGPAISGTVKSDAPEFEIVEPPSEEPVAPPPVAAAGPRRQARAQAVDDEEPEPSEIPEEEDEAAPPEVGAYPAPPVLALNVGARLGTREFQYSDPMPGLRDYNLTLSPNLALRLQWFPVAHFERGTLSNFGIDLRGEMLVGVSSANRTGQKFSTSATTFGVGLRARLPLPEMEFGALLGYGRHAFGLDGTSMTDPDVPDVSYGFLRAGLDFRWQAVTSPWSVQLSAAYLIALSHGEIAETVWFPHTSGDGLEAEVGVGYALSRVLGLEVTFGVQRYFMSFDPELDDPGVRPPTRRVAGGAVDQYLSSRVGMVIRL